MLTLCQGLQLLTSEALGHLSPLMTSMGGSQMYRVLCTQSLKVFHLHTRLQRRYLAYLRYCRCCTMKSKGEWTILEKSEILINTNSQRSGQCISHSLCIEIVKMIIVTTIRRIKHGSSKLTRNPNLRQYQGKIIKKFVQQKIGTE